MARLTKYIPHTILALGLLGTWYSVRVDETMRTRAHYTVGELIGSNYTPKSGKSYHYKYYVAGQLYKSTDSRKTGMNTENGSRFLVEYDSLDPEVSLGHFTVVIPDSIQTSPPNGWRIPPVPLPATKE